MNEIPKILINLEKFVQNIQVCLNQYIIPLKEETALTNFRLLCALHKNYSTSQFLQIFWNNTDLGFY